MSIQFYLDPTFLPGAQVDAVDTFTGDGVTATFVCVNKSIQRLGATIQVDAQQYWQYNGGFTKDIGTNSFTLSSVPPLGAQIVAPGLNQVVETAFDADPVPGVTNPTVSEVPVWIGDSTDISGQYYTGLPTASGIEISLVDLVSGAGAGVSWTQLASADPTTGLAMTYAATGEALYTAPINAFGTLTSSVVAGASSMLCSTASAFAVGDYVIIDIGTVNQEIRKIGSITASPATITYTTTFDFNHSAGINLYTCGRKFWVKVTVPIGVAGGTAVNFYDLGLRRRGRIISRF